MRGPFFYPTCAFRGVNEHPGGVFTSWNPGPMHESCCLYTALACPFFKHKTARRHFNPWRGCTRGDAAILGFAGCGTAFFAELTWAGTRYLFAYTELLERIPFEASRQLLPLYNEAVARDAEFIDIGSRLYWGDSPDDIERLKQCKQVDDATIAAYASRML
jgi:hypothetical protein